MGRRSKSSDPKYYCPKCERKTLARESYWDRDAGTWRIGWVCKHVAPKKVATLKEGIDSGEVTGTVDDYHGYYDGYDAKYDEQKKAQLRKEQYDKCVEFYAKTPPCGLEIKVPGRDAKIVDYFSVLDLMIRDGAAIKHHLLETHPGIYKKGLEVLYSSDRLDLVKLRDQHGVGCYIYWKEGWDPNFDGAKLDFRRLAGAPSGYIYFKGIELKKFFQNSHRVQLWKKDEVRGTFVGKWTKKLAKEIVEFVKAFELALPELEKQAIADDATWSAWYKELCNDVKAAAGHKIRVDTYDGEQKEARVSINGWLSKEQVLAIAAIFENGASE